VRSRKQLSISLLSGLAMLDSLQAQEVTPSIDELWQIVQQQQAEIAMLKSMLTAANEEIDATGRQLELTEQQVAATGDFVESLAIPEDRDTTIGAYGELHYNRLDADDAENDTDEIDLHRFVMFLNHRFNDRVRFFSELEVEHSLVGDDAAGEVELEQAYVDFAINDSLSARTGLFLLPIGILNETHEPPTFYGVERNNVESVIIPATWWEAGAMLHGNIANGLSWDFALHSGLEIPTSGASAFRVRSGRQKVSEALANDPAYTFRLKYTGMPGLELGASLQYQADPSQQPGDGLDSGTMLAAHAIYQAGDFTLRGLYSQWDFSGSAVEAAGVDRQQGWYLEPSYRLSERWGIYARYEEIDGARNLDKFSQWETGFNYWPLPDVVLKLDYKQRDHDLASELGEDFSGIDLGFGYQF